MKSTTKYVAALLALGLTSCTSLITKTPEVSYQPYTNLVSGLVSQLPVTNYTFTVNPTTQKILSTAQQMTPLAPPPFSDILSGLLLLASTGLGLYARSKNKQAGITQSALNAVVAGVETGLKSTSPDVALRLKQSIQAAAAAAGAQPHLDSTVQSVTKQMS